MLDIKSVHGKKGGEHPQVNLKSLYFSIIYVLPLNISASAMLTLQDFLVKKGKQELTTHAPNIKNIFKHLIKNNVLVSDNIANTRNQIPHIPILTSPSVKNEVM